MSGAKLPNPEPGVPYGAQLKELLANQVHELAVWQVYVDDPMLASPKEKLAARIKRDMAHKLAKGIVEHITPVETNGSHAMPYAKQCHMVCAIMDGETFTKLHQLANTLAGIEERLAADARPESA